MVFRLSIYQFFNLVNFSLNLKSEHLLYLSIYQSNLVLTTYNRNNIIEYQLQSALLPPSTYIQIKYNPIYNFNDLNQSY